MSVAKNKSTPDEREFWRHVEDISQEVSKWPPWMQGDRVVAEPAPEEAARQRAEASLTIRYEADAAWGINYTLPNKSVIPFNNRQDVRLVMAQLRGMLADFASRETARLRQRITELEEEVRRLKSKSEPRSTVA